MVQCLCDKRAYFGLIGDKKPTHCYECKKDNMVDIVHKKCKCKKHQPLFGLVGDKKPSCCNQCKKDNMINIIHKRCMCDKIPVYGLIGDKKATHCFDCKTDNMINVVHKRCKSIHCDTLSSKKYDDYCSHCFKNIFPKKEACQTLLLRQKYFWK